MCVSFYTCALELHYYIVNNFSWKWKFVLQFCTQGKMLTKHSHVHFQWVRVTKQRGQECCLKPVSSLPGYEAVVEMDHHSSLCHCREGPAAAEESSENWGRNESIISFFSGISVLRHWREPTFDIQAEVHLLSSFQLGLHLDVNSTCVWNCMLDIVWPTLFIPCKSQWHWICHWPFFFNQNVLKSWTTFSGPQLANLLLLFLGGWTWKCIISLQYRNIFTMAVRAERREELLSLHGKA